MLFCALRIYAKAGCLKAGFLCKEFFKLVVVVINNFCKADAISRVYGSSDEDVVSFLENWVLTCISNHI